MGTKSFELNYNFNTKFMQKIRTFRDKFCDINLWAEGKSIAAHKLILSIASPFFQKMINKMTQTHNGPCASKLFVFNLIEEKNK